MSRGLIYICCRDNRGKSMQSGDIAHYKRALCIFLCSGPDPGDLHHVSECNPLYHPEAGAEKRVHAAQVFDPVHTQRCIRSAD